jgi:hypothetical protein
VGGANSNPPPASVNVRRIDLARMASIIILIVLTMVNLSLFRLGGTVDDDLLKRWRRLGLVGALVCVVVIVLG